VNPTQRDLPHPNRQRQDAQGQYHRAQGLHRHGPKNARRHQGRAGHDDPRGHEQTRWNATALGPDDPSGHARDDRCRKPRKMEVHTGQENDLWIEPEEIVPKAMCREPDRTDRQIAQAQINGPFFDKTSSPGQSTSSGKERTQERDHDPRQGQRAGGVAGFDPQGRQAAEGPHRLTPSDRPKGSTD